MSIICESSSSSSLSSYQPTCGMMQGARHFGIGLLHFPSAKQVASILLLSNRFFYIFILNFFHFWPRRSPWYIFSVSFLYFFPNFFWLSRLPQYNFSQTNILSDKYKKPYTALVDIKIRIYLSFALKFHSIIHTLECHHLIS